MRLRLRNFDITLTTWRMLSYRFHEALEKWWWQSSTKDCSFKKKKYFFEGGFVFPCEDGGALPKHS